MAGPTAFQRNAFQTVPLAWQIGAIPPSQIVYPPNGQLFYVAASSGSNVVTTIFQGNPVIHKPHVNDVGVAIAFNVGIYARVGSTSLTLVFTKPDTSTFSVEAPAVYLGSLEISTPIGRFPPQTYVVYVFGSNALDQAGLWSVELVDDTVTVSALGYFTVLP